MPGFIGQKLCPDLIIIPPNFDKYTSVSERVRTVFAEYDPNYSTMSLDEAYLDITEHLETRRVSSDDERTFPGYSHPELMCRCTSNNGMYMQHFCTAVVTPGQVISWLSVIDCCSYCVCCIGSLYLSVTPKFYTKP